MNIEPEKFIVDIALNCKGLFVRKWVVPRRRAEMIHWCHENNIPVECDYPVWENYLKFEFKNEQDAVLFKLQWG